MKTVNVIIPSYGRKEVLERCLAALLRQSFTDFDLLCVCRASDEPTRALVKHFQVADPRVREVLVEEAGLVAALNAGLRNADATFVSFTDDDAEAPPHWLQTIVDHFGEHPECGAVGGPDRLQIAVEALRNPPTVKQVGVYSWTGRWHATHHCAITADYVKANILKGVNMTYRQDLIRGMVIGEGLRARTCTEPGIAARVRRAGKELHFVRDAWVLHHCAPRLEEDNRTDMRTAHALAVSYNNAYVLWRYQPLYTCVAAHLRDFLVGSKHVPGLMRLVFCPGKRDIFVSHAIQKLQGGVAGWQSRAQKLKLAEHAAHRSIEM